MKRITALIMALTVTVSAVSGNPIVARAAETDAEPSSGDITLENADGQITAGGYIEMPWDNDTPVVSEDLGYKEAVDMIVEDKPLYSYGKKEKDPELDTYVTETSADSRYPDKTESGILAYLQEKYPPTRSQDPYGSCWAHSAVALSEFYLISKGLKDDLGKVDNTVNYSELQLAYFCYDQAPDPVNGSTGDRVYFNSGLGEKKSFMDFGGNLDFASQSLMRFNGVTNDEGPAAYSNAANVIQNGMAAEYASLMDTAHLKNEYHINIRSNPGLVKQAIKENGIVGVSIYADEQYMNFQTDAYYNNVDDSSNHAVAIVGWDDSYPAGNFKTDPHEDGAWLVRNSWTENTGYSFYSYFWLSYKDRSLRDTAYVFEMADRESGEYYENNYNYDSQTHNTTMADAVRAANVFTAMKDSEALKAVQIDSTMNIPGAYTVEIYTNLADASNPESGTKAEEVSGSLPFAGKYTIPLNSAVDLTRGQTFSVVVTTQRAIDQETDLTWKEQVVMDTAINEGESFIRSGSAWTDISKSSNGGRYGNLCIRALTDTKGESSLPDSILNLTVRGRTNQAISLAWSAAKDAEGYEIWYSDSENGEYVKAGQTSADERSYRHTGLAAGTTYYHKVYPVKGGSKYEAGVSPVAAATTVTAIPAVEIVSAGKYQAVVRWDALDNCDGYEYSYGKGNYSFPPKETTDNVLTLRQLDPGSTHWFKVRSFKNEGADKAYSDYCNVEFTTQSGECHAVTNLKAEPYNSSMVKLTWDDQEDIWYYTLEQSTDNVNFSQVEMYYIGSVEPRTVRYAKDLVTNTKYYFRIRASVYSFSGGSTPIEYVSGSVSCYPKLKPVSGLNASVSDGAIKLQWSGITGAAYYSVYRKQKSTGEYVPLAVVPASQGENAYTDTSAIHGRYYYYRVYGCRTNVLTDAQGECNITCGALIPLGEVNDLTVSDITASSAVLSWSAIPGAQGYVISRYETNWVEVERVGAGYTSYTLKKLLPNTSYRMAVQAFTDDSNGGGTGIDFKTLEGSPAEKSFFTISDTETVYNGSPQGATVACSNDEVSGAGYSVLYGRKVNGAVSSYSTDKPSEAGTYGIMIRTKASTYYTATELTDENWIFTISPKPIVPAVTLSKENYTYTGNECRPEVTVKDGNTVLRAGTDYSVSYSDNIHAGSNSAVVTVTPCDGGSYSFDETKKYFTIGKATTNVTIEGGNKTVTYGAGSFTLSALASIPGSGVKVWSWSSDAPGVAEIDPSTGAVTVTGQGTAVISVGYSSNDTEGSGSMTLTVNKAALTVTANDNVITYGDEPAGNGVKYSGFVNGDTSGAVTGSITYSYDYKKYDDAGNSYVITPSGLSAANYDITYAPGTLTVQPKEAGISWTGTELTYNGEQQKPFATATGLLNNDSCTVTVSTASPAIDAGSYTATADSLSNPNYRLPAAKTTAFNIGKADCGNRSASGSARYGNIGEVDLSPYLPAGGSLKTTGISCSDPDQILDGSPYVTGNKLCFAIDNDQSKKDKTAVVTVPVNGGKNFNDHAIDVTLTVLDKSPQTVTFQGITGGKVSKTYGDEDFTYTAASDASGAITYESSDTSVATVGASDGKIHILKTGETTITARAAPTDTHEEGSASYALTVGKKEIGIKWTGTVFTYDRSMHTPTAEATGLIAPDTCLLTVTGGQVNAGDHTASVTALDNDDYKLPAVVTQSYKINKAAVTVAGIIAGNKEYDGTTDAVLGFENVSFTGKKDGDTLSVTAKGAFADANAGTGKTVGISDIVLGGASAANYELASTGQQKQTSADISKKPATVKAKDQTVPLNGLIANGVSYAELDGALSGHYLSSVVLTSSPTDNVTDSGTITPSTPVINNGSTNVTGNYDISCVPGVLTVTKGVPLITAPRANDLTYNGQKQKLLTEGSGPDGTIMKYSLNKDGEYSENVPEGINAGDHTVWYMVEGGSNYEDISPRSIDVKIKKADLSDAAVILGPSLTYSGAVQTQTISKLTSGGETIPSDEYSVTGNTALNAGSYKLTVTAVSGGNCTGSVQKEFVVSKKDIVAAVAVTGTYSFTGSAVTPVCSVTDGINELSPTDYSVSFSDNVNAGTGRVTVTESATGNYSFSTVNEEFAIGKAAARTLADISVGQALGKREIKASVAGLMPGNAGTVTYTAGSATTTGSAIISGYTVDAGGNVSAAVSGGMENDTIILPVTISSTNYADSAVNVVITLIRKSDAGVKISGESVRTYGDEEFTLTGSVTDEGANGAWTWESSNEAVATVNDAGVVTIVGGGTAVITASYESDTSIGSATLTLTVNPRTVEIPKAAIGLKWTGSEQTGVASGEGYTVTNGAATDVGSYTATATLTRTTDYRWSDGTTEPKSVLWSIDKGDGPDAPTGLSGESPTTPDGSDGKISGVTEKMEYSDDPSFSTVTPCIGETITGLTAGTYYVRVKETATHYAGKAATVVVPVGDDVWNLYEDPSEHEYRVFGISVNGIVPNSNAKSKAYYDAKLKGSVITVKVTGDRKKAASNAVLEFDLGNAGAVEYALPVSYVKPSFKLSSAAFVIKNGTETALKTNLLVKNASGTYEPFDMTDVKVAGTGAGTVTKEDDGSIRIRTSAAGKGKISISKDGWDGAKPVSLAYTVKGSDRDALSVDLQGLKTVVVNSNAKGQEFTFDVTLNGVSPEEGAVTIVDSKNTGLAAISGGKLVIAYRDGVKNGNYTVTLQAGGAKANVKIKVSDKAVDEAVTAKVQTKYDVVTKQCMVVVPVFKDMSGHIEAVSVSESGFIARLNEAGNIEIDYTGDKYSVNDLNIGTLSLSLKISGLEKPVKLTLNKVKAKKTTPTVKAGTVTIPAGTEEAEGKIIGTANIVSSYKANSGMYKTIAPEKLEIVGAPKNVTAKVNETDKTEIDILSVTKNSGSVKLKLTYPGGVTKTVTVKVKKK